MVIRSFGMSWSIMGQFIATVILLEAAPTAFANIGYCFWIILICLTFLYGVLVYFFLPEVSLSKIPSEDEAVLTQDVDKRDDPRGH
jgi:phosphotransferase system  glucose/maltose/N-acetylglucosamine-specific IIC component